MSARRIEALHRATRPLKDWQPGQQEQAITRQTRAPIHQALASNVVFTAVDHNSISWAAGSIIFSNGVTYPIAAGTLELTGTHYIYHIRGDNTLWASTTFSAAVAWDRALMAIATAVAVGGKAKIIVLHGDVVGYVGDLPDVIKDTHIDWGAGAGQVDADDVPESATRKWEGDIDIALLAMGE